MYRDEKGRIHGSDPGPRRRVPARRPEWFERAACRGSDPDIFHPERSGRYVGTSLAKAICRTCPVAEGCLEWALKWNEPGVYGGTSVRERRRLRKERGIQ
jgi:WhiB family transcriptional regulator, redox-sensing transcriptional regulator